MSGLVIFEHLHRGQPVILQVQEYKGRKFATYRKWYESDGNWKATDEGVTIPLDQLPALTAALMRHHGLEPPEGLENAS